MNRGMASSVGVITVGIFADLPRGTDGGANEFTRALVASLAAQAPGELRDALVLVAQVAAEQLHLALAEASGEDGLELLGGGAGFQVQRSTSQHNPGRCPGDSPLRAG